MEDSLLLLRFNCPDKTCDYIAGGWPDLRSHASHRHGAELWSVDPHAQLTGSRWNCLADSLPLLHPSIATSASSSRRSFRMSRSSTRRLSFRITCHHAYPLGVGRQPCRAAWRSRPRWASTRCASRFMSRRRERLQLNPNVDSCLYRCQFCRSCFFADEDLAKHMKERHEDCFVCKRAGVKSL